MENRIFAHYNAVCLKCGAIREQMARVGALFFCWKCVKEEFNTNDPVRQERARYLVWLHKSLGPIDRAGRA